MPLYELFVISKSMEEAIANNNVIKAVMKRTAEKLLDHETVVRKLEYLGRQDLPYRMKLQEKYIYSGNYWQIQFFGSVKSQEKVKYLLRYDPDIVRYTFLKKADSLKGFVHP